MARVGLLLQIVTPRTQRGKHLVKRLVRDLVQVGTDAVQMRVNALPLLQLRRLEPANAFPIVFRDFAHGAARLPLQGRLLVHALPLISFGKNGRLNIRRRPHLVRNP